MQIRTLKEFRVSRRFHAISARGYFERLQNFTAFVARVKVMSFTASQGRCLQLRVCEIALAGASEEASVGIDVKPRLFDVGLKAPDLLFA